VNVGLVVRRVLANISCDRLLLAFLVGLLRRTIIHRVALLAFVHTFIGIRRFGCTAGVYTVCMKIVGWLEAFMGSHIVFAVIAHMAA
jgi:hypothetical protein